jgi:hypothetical protein
MRFTVKLIACLALVLVIRFSATYALLLSTFGTTSSPSPSPTPTETETGPKPQFDVEVVYAYVDPRKDHFTCQNPLPDKTAGTTLNAVSLYPSIVYFNFTLVSSAEIESCDAKIEVYLIQITANTGATENYTFSEHQLTSTH